MGKRPQNAMLLAGPGSKIVLPRVRYVDPKNVDGERPRSSESRGFLPFVVAWIIAEKGSSVCKSQDLGAGAMLACCQNDSAQMCAARRIIPHAAMYAYVRRTIIHNCL